MVLGAGYALRKPRMMHQCHQSIQSTSINVECACSWHGMKRSASFDSPLKRDIRLFGERVACALNKKRKLSCRYIRLKLIALRRKTWRANITPHNISHTCVSHKSHDFDSHGIASKDLTPHETSSRDTTSHPVLLNYGSHVQMLSTTHASVASKNCLQGYFCD